MAAAIAAMPALASTVRAQSAAPAQTSDEVVILEKLEVTERVVANQAAASLQQARQSLATISGSAGLVDQKDVERGRAATVADLLKFQPGVFAQSTGGTDAIKISIRGSAINRGAGVFRHGTAFLFDGLAITGPGGTPFELFEAQGLQYTEVLLGANAFQYGALSLGGAINYVTHTGHTSPGNYLRVEGGSFGYIKAQFSTGGVRDDFDYYVSLTASERDGYQDHTYTKTAGVNANFGYRFNDKVDTRFFVRNRRQYQENAGGIHLNPSTTAPNRPNIRTNPTGANPTSVANHAEGIKDKEGSTWIANRTTINIDEDSRLVAGVVWHNYPQTLSSTGQTYTPPTAPAVPNPYSPVPQQISHWPWRDINGSLRYERTDETFGRELNSNLGVFYSRHIHSGVRTYNNTVPHPYYGTLLKEAFYDGSHDFVIATGADLQFTERLNLNGGLSLVNVRRDINISYIDPYIPVQNSQWPTANVYSTWQLAPRIGFIFDVTPEIALFGNVSRSIDPPNTWNYSGSGATNNTLPPLKVQRSTTAELGIRGQAGIFEGSLTVYRSWIDGELLSVQTDPGPPVQTREFNAEKTIHQGVEIGLSAKLWSDGEEQGTALTLRQTYTFNDFFYERDARYDSHELPGIPRHVYSAELFFEHRTGFYAGLNVTAASNYYVDYANSFQVPAYSILGLRAGYEPRGKNWQVFVDVQNLTDKRYVSVASTQDNANGNDGAYFSPGDGRGVFAGFSVHF